MSKRLAILTALAGAMMASVNPMVPEMSYSRKRGVKKTPMTNKQKKARNKSKRAKKARK